MAAIDGIWLGDIFEQEVPTGAVNGVNDTFTLSSTPQADTSVMVFVNGVIKAISTDWSLNNSNPLEIIFTTPPATGQKIYVFYVKGRE